MCSKYSVFGKWWKIKLRVFNVFLLLFMSSIILFRFQLVFSFFLQYFQEKVQFQLNILFQTDHCLYTPIAWSTFPKKKKKKKTLISFSLSIFVWKMCDSLTHVVIFPCSYHVFLSCHGRFDKYLSERKKKRKKRHVLFVAACTFTVRTFKSFLFCF